MDFFRCNIVTLHGIRTFIIRNHETDKDSMLDQRPQV